MRRERADLASKVAGPTVWLTDIPWERVRGEGALAVALYEELGDVWGMMHAHIDCGLHACPGGQPGGSQGTLSTEPGAV